MMYNENVAIVDDWEQVWFVMKFVDRIQVQ